MLNLIYMNQEEYQSYIKDSLEEFKRQLLLTGDRTEQEAEETANKQIFIILPDGIKTKDHFFFNVVDDTNGKKVGILWLATIYDDKGTPAIFIYDIRIEADLRGKGYGKKTLAALEEFTKEKNINKVSLHVFGHNQVAFELYKKTGYKIVKEHKDKEGKRTLSYRMEKEIE